MQLIRGIYEQQHVSGLRCKYEHTTPGIVTTFSIRFLNKTVTVLSTAL